MLIYYFLSITLCSCSELFEDYYEKADNFIKNMTLEQKVSQMFFPQMTPDPSSHYEDISTITPGGYLFFAYNFRGSETDIKNYIYHMQSLSKKAIELPLGILVDEEGGIVTRVSYHQRDEPFPSPQSIYNESGIEGILKIDQEKRDLLRKFLVNVNLAPVADISYNPKDMIYKRTLGRNATTTADYIAKDVESYVNDNFTCCAKHFPGYGNNSDSHIDVTRDNRSYETFLNEDFLSFKAAIEKKIPMILVAHNIVKCKDPIYPASLSKTWNNILRNDLNFSGLILTDDLSMGAITKFKSNESVAVLAVKAGVDILLTSKYKTQRQEVIDAVKSGNISEDIINKACRRIIAWKFQYLKDYPKYEEPKEPKDEDTPKDDNTTLIAVLSVLGGLLVIGGIVFLFIYCQKKKTNTFSDSDEKMRILADIK